MAVSAPPPALSGAEDNEPWDSARIPLDRKPPLFSFPSLSPPLSSTPAPLGEAEALGLRPEQLRTLRLLRQRAAADQRDEHRR